MNPCAKVITGPLHTENKTASDWGCQGFIAYGCYGYAVVIDPVNLQVIQTLGPHAGCVTHVRWSGEDYHHAFATASTYNLHLVVADSTGAVVIWDVVTGQRRAEFADNQPTKPVLGLEWYSGHDESHDLLMVLRSPDSLELWDAFSGVRLWKKQFGEQLLGFALDPFDIQRLIMLCESPYVLVLTDVNVLKGPSDGYRLVRINDPQPIAPAVGSQRKISPGSEKLLSRSSTSLTKMASLATNILSGTEQSRKRSGVTDEDSDLLTSCKQVIFNPAHRHIALLVFSTEIHMIDLDVDLTIGMIRLDKSSPNFVKVLPCKKADMLYCLHGNGSVSVRVRRQMNNPEKIQTAGILDMTYDLKCQSDSMRLLRHSKVYSMVYHPVSEKQVALILSDSRVIFLDVFTREFSKPKNQGDLCYNKPKLSMADMISSCTIMSPAGHHDFIKGQVTLRIVVSGLVSGIFSPVTALERRPGITNCHVVAVGSGSGTIQLVDIDSGQVENEFKLFMSPLRGMDWIDRNKLLAFSYPDPPSYGNRAVKSDVVILDVVSGIVVPLFEGVDKKGPILKVTVSAAGSLCIVLFKQGKMELWNLKTRQMVREIVIDELIKATDVAWYPHVIVQRKILTVMNNDGQKRTMERRVNKEQVFICGQIEGGSSIIRLIVEDSVVSGPLFFGTSNVFEGQNQKAEIVKLAWKEKIIVMADKGGHLFFCDAGQKGVNLIKKFSESNGCRVENIMFAPGMNTSIQFLVQYTNIVDVWECLDGKPELVTSSPNLPLSLVRVCWTGPESIVMATEDAFLHVIDMSRQLPTSPRENNKDDFFHVKEIVMRSKNSPVSKWKLSGIFSPALMEPKEAFLLKYSLQCNIEPVNEAVKNCYSLIDSDVLRYICGKSTSTAERCCQVARGT